MNCSERTCIIIYAPLYKSPDFYIRLYRRISAMYTISTSSFAGCRYHLLLLVGITISFHCTLLTNHCPSQYKHMKTIFIRRCPSYALTL